MLGSDTSHTHSIWNTQNPRNEKKFDRISSNLSPRQVHTEEGCQRRGVVGDEVECGEKRDEIRDR